jgi:hypothetical protein
MHTHTTGPTRKQTTDTDVTGETNRASTTLGLTRRRFYSVAAATFPRAW